MSYRRPEKGAENSLLLKGQTKSRKLSALKLYKDYAGKKDVRKVGGKGRKEEGMMIFLC